MHIVEFSKYFFSWSDSKTILNPSNPPSANPSRRGSREWGGSKHQSHATRPVTGSTMAVFFVALVHHWFVLFQC
jgi:hypothetical protein